MRRFKRAAPYGAAYDAVQCGAAPSNRRQQRCHAVAPLSPINLNLKNQPNDFQI